MDDFRLNPKQVVALKKLHKAQRNRRLADRIKSVVLLGTGWSVSDQDEMKNSYLTYAMSVIVSRAVPDVRDGLKPSQRRILVAMNDLNLSPGARRTKCAKICGETMGNYHPHGDVVIYPTLVRMA